MPGIVLVFLLGLAATARGEVLPETQPQPSKEVGKVSGGAGSTYTAGSHRYHRFGLYGDANWEYQPLAPYAWSEYDVDNSARSFSLGGGAWNDLSDDWRAKGGLGVTVGRYKNSNETSRSLTLETGVERFLGDKTLGGEYRYTAGSIGTSGIIRSNDQAVQNHGGSGGKNGEAGPVKKSTADRYRYNEFSIYARLPAGETVIGLRATLGLPSYSSSIISETVSWTIPIVSTLSTRLSLSLEQGRQANVYTSAGLDYRFR